MTPRQRFDHLITMGVRKQTDDLQCIKELIDMLLIWLYKPTQENWVRDPIQCDRYCVGEEPINWGDLSCSDVKANRDEMTYTAIVEEAAPGECPSLVAYVEQHLRWWGWEVEVRTEW